MEDTTELQEERRLAYVGITRAKQRLYVTRAAVRSQWGQAADMMPSQFLDEIPDSLIDWKRREAGVERMRASWETDGFADDLGGWDDDDFGGAAFGGSSTFGSRGSSGSGSIYGRGRGMVVVWLGFRLFVVWFPFIVVWFPLRLVLLWFPLPFGFVLWFFRLRFEVVLRVAFPFRFSSGSYGGTRGGKVTTRRTAPKSDSTGSAVPSSKLTKDNGLNIADFAVGDHDQPRPVRSRQGHRRTRQGPQFGNHRGLRLRRRQRLMLRVAPIEKL